MRLLFILIALFCFIEAHAQECTPVSTTALFLEDFGDGEQFGPALPAGTTTYSYGSIATDNRYVLANFSGGLYTWLWHAGPDHTEDDVDGYMLLINASHTAGTFYQRTFTDLCPNTDYYFSCFVTNLIVPTACIGDPLKPKLNFAVLDPEDESTIATATSGQLYVSTFQNWSEYGVHFRTGTDQTSARVQIVNATASGSPPCGNDFAIDDISLRLCNVQIEQSVDLCDLPDGQLTVGSQVYTEPGTYLDVLPIANSCNDTLITTVLTGTTRRLPTLHYAFCQGDSVEVDGRYFTESAAFIDTLTGPAPDCPRFQPYEIVAQPPQSRNQEVTLCNGESIQVGNNTYSLAGTYVDSLSTPAGCDSIVITTIATGNIAVAVDPATVNLDLGDELQLSSTVSFSDDYRLSWQPATAFSCTDCPDPLLQATSSGTYQLIATDLPSGCADSTTVTVMVNTCEAVFVPNAFSPNQDQINDQLEVFTDDCFTRLLSWRIFDRWGGLVYETNDQLLPNQTFTGWDGQRDGLNSPTGTYFYQLVLERRTGGDFVVVGEVVLVR